MDRIALFGAGGKMGVRLSRNLKESRYRVAHVEVSAGGGSPSRATAARSSRSPSSSRRSRKPSAPRSRWRCARRRTRRSGAACRAQAAHDFMLGHLNIELAIAFGAFPEGKFSDGALRRSAKRVR